MRHHVWKYLQQGFVSRCFLKKIMGILKKSVLFMSCLIFKSKQIRVYKSQISDAGICASRAVSRRRRFHSEGFKQGEEKLMVYEDYAANVTSFKHVPLFMNDFSACSNISVSSNFIRASVRGTLKRV